MQAMPNPKRHPMTFGRVRTVGRVFAPANPEFDHGEAAKCFAELEAADAEYRAAQDAHARDVAVAPPEWMGETEARAERARIDARADAKLETARGKRSAVSSRWESELEVAYTKAIHKRLEKGHRDAIASLYDAVANYAPAYERTSRAAAELLEFAAQAQADGIISAEQVAALDGIAGELSIGGDLFDVPRVAEALAACQESVRGNSQATRAARDSLAKAGVDAGRIGALFPWIDLEANLHPDFFERQPDNYRKAVLIDLVLDWA